MKIVAINATNVGSTGRIMTDIAEAARHKGHKVYLCYPKSRTNSVKYQKGDIFIGNRFTRNLGIYLELFGFVKLCHLISTLIFIGKLLNIKPDIIHLHNLHGSYINIPLFFRYIKYTKTKVVWTLHDCWPFTGHCAHYVDIDCNKWKSKCNNCPKYNIYPRTFFDNSSYLYKLKQSMFLNVPCLRIVTVSRWLSEQVEQSFLKKYPRSIIYPGIDLSIFKYYKNAISTINQQIGIEEKFVIMAAATSWGDSKGLSDYLKLSKMLKEDEIIILVGINSDIILPNNIIKIPRTNSKQELAYLYSRADVLLSLSKAETFGMTIAESLFCGTPVIVYDNTAQCELLLPDIGFSVETGNVNKVYEKISIVKDEKVKNDRMGNFLSVRELCSVEISNEKYIDLYESL